MRSALIQWMFAIKAKEKRYNNKSVRWVAKYKNPIFMKWMF